MTRCEYEIKITPRPDKWVFKWQWNIERTTIYSSGEVVDYSASRGFARNEAAARRIAENHVKAWQAGDQRRKATGDILTGGYKYKPEDK